MPLTEQEEADLARMYRIQSGVDKMLASRQPVSSDKQDLEKVVEHERQRRKGN